MPLRILSIVLIFLLICLAIQPVTGQTKPVTDKDSKPQAIKPVQPLEFESIYTNDTISIYKQKRAKRAGNKAGDIKDAYDNAYTRSYESLTDQTTKDAYYRRNKRLIYYKEGTELFFKVVSEFGGPDTDPKAKLTGYSIKVVDDLYEALVDRTLVKLPMITKKASSKDTQDTIAFDLDQLEKASPDKASARGAIDAKLEEFFSATYNSPKVIQLGERELTPKSERMNDLVMIHYPYYFITWDTLYISAKLFDQNVPPATMRDLPVPDQNTPPSSGPVTLQKAGAPKAKQKFEDYQTLYFVLETIERSYLFWTFCELYRAQPSTDPEEYKKFVQDYDHYSSNIYQEARDQSQTTILKK